MGGDRIKVKRDGPRGWHWITSASFDPAIHTVHADEPAPAGSPAPQPDVQPAPAGRPRGRPPKQPKT